jgi:hypothetical protein
MFTYGVSVQDVVALEDMCGKLLEGLKREADVERAKLWEIVKAMSPEEVRNLPMLTARPVDPRDVSKPRKRRGA